MSQFQLDQPTVISDKKKLNYTHKYILICQMNEKNRFGFMQIKQSTLLAENETNKKK